MSLYVDKYKPETFSEFVLHKREAEKLSKLAQSPNFPHLILYGPPGAGKRTLINCLLKELYGNGAEKLRLEEQTFSTPSNKKVEIATVSSNYHLEVHPSDAGIYDRIVVQELIKTVASTQQLDRQQQREFKVVILMEVDRLTKEAQHALRRTMEKYMSSCRLILCANSISKVIAAIRSRCLPVRVCAPTVEEMTDILFNTVARREGFQKAVSPEFIRTVAQASDGNLRRAMLLLEAARLQQTASASSEWRLVPPDWQVYLKETAQFIISEQSPRRLQQIRGRLYELLTHCIPTDVIMKTLLDELLLSCDDLLKKEVVQLAAQYEHQMQLGSKPIFHLEAFVAKFMAVYKKFMDETLTGIDW